MQESVNFPPAGPRGDRRAAPFRRGAASSPGRKGGRARRACSSPPRRSRAPSPSPSMATSTCPPCGSGHLDARAACGPPCAGPGSGTGCCEFVPHRVLERPPGLHRSPGHRGIRAGPTFARLPAWRRRWPLAGLIMTVALVHGDSSLTSRDAVHAGGSAPARVQVAGGDDRDRGRDRRAPNATLMVIEQARPLRAGAGCISCGAE
jgi:hypothetical protein